MKQRIPWSEILPDAIKALENASPDTTVGDVAMRLRDVTGYPITYDALKHAMIRGGHGVPKSRLGKNWSEEDAGSERADVPLSLSGFGLPLGVGSSFEAKAQFASQEPSNGDTIPAPEPVEFAAAKPANPLLATLVKLAIKGCSYRDLCNKFEVSPATMDGMLKEARESGYQIDVAGEHVGLKPASEEHDAMVHVDVPTTHGGWHKVGVISDTHFGSRHCAAEPLRQAVDWMLNEHRCETILFGGDLLDGVNAKVQWEQYCHSFDEQVSEAIRLLPRGPRYIGVYGNHDAWHSRENGMNMGHAITTAFRAAGRTDLDIGRSMSRDLDFDGVIVRVFHPDGGMAYAKSYQAQKNVRAMPTNPGMPHIVLAGHRHQYVQSIERGVRFVDLPCFQWGTSDYSKRKNGEVVVGGLVIAWQRGSNGSVRRMQLIDDLYYWREPIDRIEPQERRHEWARCN